MTDVICKLCHEDVFPRATEDGRVVVLDGQPALPADSPADRGRWALTGRLAWEVVPDGEVLVAGDGRMHEAEAIGLQRFHAHARKHAAPSRRPPSQEVTRGTGPRRRTGKGFGR